MQHRTIAAIAVASLVASFAANANKGAEYKPHHEKHHKKFEVTAGATYLEPSYNDGLDYLQVNSLLPSGGTANNEEQIDPEFNAGYFLSATYKISKKYDVQASWAAIETSSDDEAGVTGGTGVVYTTSNLQPFTLGTGSTLEASSTQNLDYQVLDATLGQHHNITKLLKTRLFAGIRYAKIDNDIDNRYIDTPPQGPQLAFHDLYNSTFSGVGPEAGFDMEYKVYHTLGVVGSLAGAFLVGNLDSSSNVFYDAVQNLTDSDENVRMIPALNAKLGLDWGIPIGSEQYSFGVEAGYQVAYYFDAADQVTFSADVATHHYSDVGFMGPYLNFSAAF